MQDSINRFLTILQQFADAAESIAATRARVDARLTDKERREAELHAVRMANAAKAAEELNRTK